MKTTTIQPGLLSAAVITLILALITSSLAFMPNSASAFWWPWGEHHAHAQVDDHDDDGDTVVVTIYKYLDGEAATGENADDAAFPMMATWDDPEGIGSGSGEFELSAETSPVYRTQTAAMDEGADYSVYELLDTDVVANNCDADRPFALLGYTTGESLEDALEADMATQSPSFTDLEDDQHVIVWNETCGDDDEVATSTGSLNGSVTGGLTEEEPGELEVISIDAQKTTAIANGEFEDGWQYVFYVTIPDDEPKVAMKFSDWMQTDGDDEIPVANNMRISSEQASASTTILLTAADTYSSPDLEMIDDLDAGLDGKQVEILVEVAVPADTFNGNYSTTYGVRTLP